MTLFYLVRHGDTGVRNKISGRASGIHRTLLGRQQASITANRLSQTEILAVVVPGAYY
jgi:broad specificity phosphatase PhoE